MKNVMFDRITTVMVNKIEETKQFSDRQLSFSYWWFSHKKLLRKIIVFVLLGINVVLYVYTIVFLINYLANLNKYDSWPSKTITGSVDWKSVHQLIKPDNILIKESEAIIVSPGIFDVLTWIENPNEQWYVSSASYTLRFAGNITAKKNVYLLPGEKSLLFEQNLSSTDIDAATEKVHIVFEDIDWQLVKEAQNYQLPDFAFSNTKIEALTNQITKTRITADITNRSLSGYRNVSVIAVVREGGLPIAINSTTTPDLRLNETRQIDIRFIKSFSETAEVELYAFTDNLNNSNILAN